jgi:uncharacterized protein (TIGR03083 family)
LIDIADAYVEVRERLIGVVTDPSTDVHAPVPACPTWSVRDLMAHHVGVVADVGGGRLGDQAMNLLDQWKDTDVQQARDTMTARQVAERRDRSVEELTGEWREATEAVAPWLRGEIAIPPSLPPFVGFVLVNDAVVHETDIRAALSLGRAPAGPALSLALTGYSFSLEHRIRHVGLRPLVLAYDDKLRQLGDGEVGATLRADRHELVRVMAGRRTADQILELEWEGDPTPYLSILSEYGPVTSVTSD